MKYAVRSFVESRKNRNGLFLVDMPTGSGKTYGTINILEDYIRGKCFNDVPKMFYITPLIKNIDEVLEDLKKRFIDNYELFDSNVLKLPANYECVVEHLEAVEKEIPQSLKRKKSFQALLNQVKLYNKLHNENYLDSYLATILNEIRTSYEPDFRLDLKNEINNNLKTEKERVARLNQKEYAWVKKLYPACLTKDKKVIFMTVSKFVSINDPIINKSYRFVSNSMIDKSLIFMDEFDAAKDVVLNQDIQNCCDFKINLYSMFFSIASSLKSRKFEKTFFGGSFDENDDKSSISSFNKMKKVILDAYDHFNLMYSFKLEKEEDSERYFLFDDFSLHTISSSKNKKIYVNSSVEASQNIIKFSDKETDLTSFYSIISTIKGATTYFINCCAMLARNYLNFHNEIAKKNQQELMEIDQAVSSILDPFNFDSNVAKNVSRIITNNYSLHNSNQKKDTLDTDFYVNGFRYYDFKDDMAHDTSTKISMCYLDNTPENLLLSLANKAMIVGLSATASIDTVTGNYNLTYIKNQLKDSFYIMPASDRERINENINKRIKHNKRIDVYSLAINSERTIDFAKTIFKTDIYIDLYKSLLESSKIVGSDNDDKRNFEYGRFTKVILAIKNFLLNKKSKALLILTNKNIKIDNDLFSINSINIVLDYLKKELNLIDIPKIHKLYGSDFEREKELYKNELKEGYKVIIFSSYPAVGSGQNLQYQIEEGNNSKEQDVDSLYLEYPTHILVRIDNNSIEEDLIKYIYQMETLRVKGDITPYTAQKNIKYAFRAFMKKQQNFIGQDKSVYGSASVNNNIVKILIQAVGRICRTDGKNKNDINIYVDNTIFEKVNFHFLKEENRLLNPEFEAIVNYSNKKKEYDFNFIAFLNRALDQEDRINAKINNILSVNRKKWNAESIKDWKTVRDIILRYPTISNQKLEEVVKKYEVQSVRDFYIHFPNNHKYRKYCYTINENKEKTIFLRHEKNAVELSSETSRLNFFMKVPYLKRYFIKCGYAIEFEENENMILPTIFHSIYKGILGEEVGKCILDYNNLKLIEIEDEDKYEKFDFQLKINKNIYVDFKNWASTTEFDETQEIEKARNKLKVVKGEKAIIINIYLEDDKDFYVHNQNDIITISGLFKIVNGIVQYLPKNKYDEIKTIIFGGEKYGNY